jgi:hypothetical protein
VALESDFNLHCSVLSAPLRWVKLIKLISQLLIKIKRISVGIFWFYLSGTYNYIWKLDGLSFYEEIMTHKL